MHRRMARAGFYLAYLCACQITCSAQEFKILDRRVQVHGFVSQGFIYTDENNWLTMNTSQGSAAFTDFGLNVSTPLTEKLRVGAQVYDHNLGQLGQYHPSLDWAVVDYRFKPGWAFAAAKLKPRSVFTLTPRIWTSFASSPCFRRAFIQPICATPPSLTSAAIFTAIFPSGTGSATFPIRSSPVTAATASIAAILIFWLSTDVYFQELGGLQYGADLRWNTPLKGVLIGASRMNQTPPQRRPCVNRLNPSGRSCFLLTDFEGGMDQPILRRVYGRQVAHRFRISPVTSRSNRPSDRRRREPSPTCAVGTSRALIALCKRLGSWLLLFPLFDHHRYRRASCSTFPNQTDTSLPANHIYDKVIAARVDLSKILERESGGSFHEWLWGSTYPDGFYPQVNPHGFKPNTNALVIKDQTSISNASDEPKPENAMKSRQLLPFVAAVAGILCLPEAVAGNIKVIANSRVRADTVSADEIKRIFLEENSSLRRWHSRRTGRSRKMDRCTRPS